MNRDDIIKLAKEAGFGNYAYEAAGIFARFAALALSAEREKYTGIQKFVTLPREVAEQALEALINEGEFRKLIKPLIEKSIDSIRAALDKPKNHIEQHLGMVPAGWKLVPVEPTLGMIEAGQDAHYDAEKRIQEPGAWEQGGFAKRAVRAAHVFQAMLAAAPQPPAPWCKATKRGDHVVCDDCKSAWDANDKNPPACVPAPPAVDQPQANQPAMTPIAQRKLDSLLTEGYTISGYSVYHEQKHRHGFVTGAGLVGWWRPDGMEHPQPQGEQEAAPNGATHIQLQQGAFYKRVDGKWYVWSLMKNGEPHRWYISPGTAESCLEPLAITPKQKRHQLTDEQIDAIADAMPGGLEGFIKGWGWRQFARAVLEATHNIK